MFENIKSLIGFEKKLKKKKLTQKQRIIKLLDKNKRVYCLDLRYKQKPGIAEAPARVCELRKLGFEIYSYWTSDRGKSELYYTFEKQS